MASAATILEHLLSNSPWVDREKTVDRVLWGDGDREITNAAVSWFPDIATIRKAVETGCELLVTHEPLFWDHLGVNRHWIDREPGLTKQRVLDESGLVVVRAHDSWDNWPGIGIRDSWAAGLGLTEKVADGSSGNYHAVYAIEPQPLRAFARHVAERIRPLGEDSVQVIGDPDRVVSRPALGVGCIVPDVEMIEAGADVLIGCYDGASYWAVRERQWELGAAVLTVEHGTSEMWGLENLCRHLAGQFPEVAFTYLAEHPRTWIARAE
jgi:putative NIF3 family GTP cyclohydrolase 1 type 2